MWVSPADDVIYILKELLFGLNNQLWLVASEVCLLVAPMSWQT